MQTVTYAIAVLGMVVVLGYTGQINLAQAAFFGFGAYGVALGTVTYGLPFWVSLGMGIGVAAIAGGILGLTTLRLGGHYLAMITISFQQIFDLVAVNWIAFTHGPDGIAGIPRPSLFGYELADDRAYLLLCTLVLYGLIALVWLLPQTRLGRAMRGVRENELAAEVIGVHTLRVKVTAFTLCAALGGIGGGLYAGGFAYISPDNFNFTRAVEFLSMVLLGGAQSPFGGVLGTTLLILLPEWLKEMPPSLQFIKYVYLAIYGLAVILIMVFMPEGLWGLLRRGWMKLRAPVPVDASNIPQLDLDIAVTETTPLLKLEGLQKFFGGLHAVDGIDMYRKYPNVVVLRTFSKAHGLAGLRVGYSVSHPELTQHLRVTATPFAVSQIAETAAVTSLEHFGEVVERVQSLVDERDRVTAGLRDLGWFVPEAQGNFVWLNLGADSAEFAALAGERALSVRAFADEGVRVSIGETEANTRFLELCAIYTKPPRRS